MKSFGLGAYALRGGVAVALLAGCGAPRPIGAPGATAIAPGHTLEGSWMRADAKSGDLLYVFDPGNDTVTVYSYQSRKLVGTLAGMCPRGVCAPTRPAMCG